MAGLLDALGAEWESLSWEQKLGLMLFAGAMILLSGGTLGLAFEVGMGVATPELHRLGWFVFQSGVFRWDSGGGVVVSGH